jgi:hypothetical protein
LLASALVASVNAIDTISVKGSKFFTEDGNQFFVKGMQMNTKKTSGKSSANRRKASLTNSFPTTRSLITSNASSTRTS